MMKYTFLFLFAFYQASGQSVVTGLIDGDTYVVKSGTIKERVRIEGIDTPEELWPGKWPAQPWAYQVEDSVRALIHTKTVTLETFGVDQYGRTLARIYLDGRDVAEIILRNGWAHYERNDLDKKTRRKYQRLRDYAKENKIGIWSDANVIAPKNWRKMKHPKI